MKKILENLAWFLETNEGKFTTTQLMIATDASSNREMQNIIDLLVQEGVFVKEDINGIAYYSLKTGKSSWNIKNVEHCQLKTVDLGEEIIKKFQQNDILYTVTDVQNLFPSKSKSELTRELDKLCNQRKLYKTETIVGTMYGLDTTDYSEQKVVQVNTQTGEGYDELLQTICDVAFQQNDNQKIDAILAAKLFFSDMLFFIEGNIKADGRHNKLCGMQINAEAIDQLDFEVDTVISIVNQVGEVINFVEEDDLLVLDEECVHYKFDKLNKIGNNGKSKVDNGIGKGLSGTKIFLAIAWHMLAVVEESKNNYIVAIDQNFHKSIPNATAYVCQFIKRLREYNGVTGAFDVVFASTLNADGAIDYIDNANPLRYFAEKVHVKANENPYMSVQKQIAEACKNDMWNKWKRGKNCIDNIQDGVSVDRTDKKIKTAKDTNNSSTSMAEIKANETEIRKALEEVKNAHRSAKIEFDKANLEISRMNSTSINIYYDDVQSRIIEAVQLSVNASNTLYTICQTLVLALDNVCRPLIRDNISHTLIQKIADEISLLNEESDIENDYTGSWEGASMGELANLHFEPTEEAKKIENFWKTKANAMKKKAEEKNKEKVAFKTVTTTTAKAPNTELTLEHAEKRLVKLQNDLKELAKKEKSYAEKYEKEKEKAKPECEKLEKENEKLREQIKEKDSEIEKAKQVMKSDKKQIEAKAKELKKDIEKKNKILSKLKEEENAIAEELRKKLFFKGKLKAALAEKQDHVAEVYNEISKIEEELKLQPKQIVKHEVAIDNIEFARRKIESEIECNEDKIKSICSVYESAQKMIELTKKDYESTEKQIEATKKEIEKLKK